MRLDRRTYAALIATLVLASGGCGASHDRGGGADGGASGDGALPDAARRDAGPAPTVDGGTVSCGGFGGARCSDEHWCDYPDGSFCGGDDSTGVCRPRPTGCPFLYDPVCGCDGATYANECAAQAAGVDISARGECAGSGGTACAPTRPCVGGICSGDACGEVWRCLDVARACTDDAAPYCGCDGVTFADSSTCPSRPFMFVGTCEEGVGCDARPVDCDALPPRCPAGQVPSVSGGCWGRCVEIGFCRCAGAADCPDPDRYTCLGPGGRCGPYVSG